MNKRIKKLLCLLIGAVLTLSAPCTAFAAGKVTYDGNAHEFILSPGSTYSPTDLFTDLKGLLPGDNVTQKVTIDNSADKNVKIKLYMRSLGAEAGSEDFLSKLSLTVEYADGDKMKKMFDAPASETAQLTDWVYLGTVYSGGTLDLNVTLSVDGDLSNEYQDAVGYLDWQFKVEELPVDPSDPKPPATGDTLRGAIYGTVIVVCCVVLVFVVIKRKKRTDEDEEK